MPLLAAIADVLARGACRAPRAPRRLACQLCLSALAWWPAIGWAAELPEVVPASGPPFRGRLVGVDPPWQLKFDSEGATRTLPAADLARYGQFADAVRGPQVLLAGGAVVIGDVRQIDREQLTLEADLLGRLVLPLESVAAVVFRPPGDRQRRDQLVRRLLSAAGESDRLLLNNGDELAGTLSALHDDTLSLEAAAGKLEIELERTAAIVFNPALARRNRISGLRCTVGLKDGSRLLAVALESAGPRARLTLPGGAAAEVAWDAVVALQPQGGRAVYLSDLKAAGYKQIPFLQLAWPYELDRNVAGDLLRARGRLFLKGLGMHSAARLTYPLDREYERLEGLLAVDDAAGGQGSVVFRVYVDDGSGRWEPRFTSSVVRGDEAPQPLAVDLQGIKRISLLVEFADRGDELDYADWLDVRLIR